MIGYKIFVLILAVIVLAAMFLKSSESNISNVQNRLRNYYKIVNIERSTIRKHLRIDYVLQYPELPTGCEAVSLVNALSYYGLSIDKCMFVDNYLRYYSDDYQIGFRGSPYSFDGTSTFPRAIVDTANDFLKSYFSNIVAVETTGKSFDELFEYIDNNNPVLIWIAEGYYPPGFTGDSYSYDGVTYYNYWGEHCVVLAGFDKTNNTVFVYDPIYGFEEISRDTVERSYIECGTMSMSFE